ncbi:hypothetical protein BSL78_26537 [Apostichopus japonicus]|uniref:Uncharacterized protein n=1 Tax=Stichopus japonicus TaxID=307972 RepID=A0A2G8JLK9_STIJA|nr:hypothetical protein BSL78_26537 [Apostichopus japonicus]
MEHSGHGGCAPIMSNRSQSVPDGLDVIDFSYELTPCSADPGRNERQLLRDSCPQDDHVKFINYIGYLCSFIQQSKTKLFYDGFYNETIHPGYTYEVSGRSLPAPAAQDFDVVVNKKVTIPHCGILPERDSIYLCSLPSPGKWTTTISNNWTETADQIYTVDVSFTVINDADFYVVGFSTDQENLHQKRIENDMTEWRWDERHKSNVIQQTYTNVTAGVYYFLVAPNYPESCADPHWGITHCPQFLDQILVGEESTSKISTTENDVLTTPDSHERVSLPTPYIILIVTGTVFVLVLVCFLFLYCCCKYCSCKYCSKYFWCYGPDFRRLDLPDREMYTQLQQDYHLPPTPDEGYHETSHPQMSVNPWRFIGGAVRQDSGISVVSIGHVEEHGMEMGYDDNRLRRPNGGYHPISQPYDPNQLNLPLGGVRRQISKETTM